MPPAPTLDPVLYTWTAQRAALPLAITGGNGARFFTSDGARWIDLGSMTWNAHLGHGHPGMRAALSRAAAEGLLAQPWSDFPARRQAGQALLDVAPPALGRAGKVFLCLSGAEANENAVKMAQLVTGRARVVHRARSYHGATLGMLSVSGDPRRAAFDALGATHPGLGVSWDDPYSATPCPGDLEALLRREDPRTIAAVLLEGMVGANGVRVPPPGYFRRVRELCDRHGILLICDEVLSGFGRTGAWFAIDHDGVAPDLLTCGKGLTGGYAPGGAVLVGERIAAHFDDHVLSCGLTHYAHPLTCAAIVAAIAAYREESLVPRAAALGRLLGALLAARAPARPELRDPRGLGLLWAVDLHEPDGAPATPARMARLAAALRARHVHLHKRDHMLYFAPPLVIDEATLEEGLDRVFAAVEEVFST